MPERTERELTEEYRAAELEIWSYNKGKWSAFYFLRHVLCFLRQHGELCEQNDYKDLYNETIVLLILQAHVVNHWTKHKPADQQGWIEFLADLEIKNMGNDDASFSMEMIDDYLAYRKRMWADGQKYTKTEYGFLS